MAKKKKYCTELFAHSMDKLETVSIDSKSIVKKCPHCDYKETLKRSNSRVLYVNNIAIQKKKWGADDNRKETLQPMNNDGSVNDEFTEAYGYNPFDDRTKLATPEIQGGLA